jgi:hypothetical protein
VTSLDSVIVRLLTTNLSLCPTAEQILKTKVPRSKLRMPGAVRGSYRAMSSRKSWTSPSFDVVTTFDSMEDLPQLGPMLVSRAKKALASTDTVSRVCRATQPIQVQPGHDAAWSGTPERDTGLVRTAAKHNRGDSS